jgi:hypothetical protein
MQSAAGKGHGRNRFADPNAAAGVKVPKACTDIVYLIAKGIGPDRMSGAAMPIGLNLPQYIALPWRGQNQRWIVPRLLSVVSIRGR